LADGWNVDAPGVDKVETDEVLGVEGSQGGTAGPADGGDLGADAADRSPGPLAFHDDVGVVAAGRGRRVDSDHRIGKRWEFVLDAGPRPGRSGHGDPGQS
jgi:hypothetical protein